MIGAGHLTLAVAYTMLAAITGWLLSGRAVRTFHRALLIPLLVWFGLVLLYVPNHLLGWPTNEEPVEELYMVGYSIGKLASAIYIWGIPLQGDETASWWVLGYSPEDPQAPRAYKIPYYRALHKALEQWRLGKSQKGIPILRNVGKKQKSKRKLADTGSSKWKSEQYEFLVLNPRNILPPKQIPQP